MASIQNLASGVLVSDIGGSDTSLNVNCGEGSSSTLTAVWPSAPFYITVMPAYPTLGVANSLNSEIMLVSALSASDNVVTMTVSRGQRGTTAKAFSEGAIITNGIYTADMDYAQAVGKSFFPATFTDSITGSYTISDSMLPNTPEDGMSIRVVFEGIQEDTTATPKLRLNSGSYYNIYAGNNLSSDVGDTTTKAMVKGGVIYELTYYNGAWYVLNLVASSSITSDNVDWATFGNSSSYIQLGKVLICWGKKTFPNPNTGDYGETNSGEITFPKAYASAPQVVCQMHDQAGGCGEYCAIGGVGTTSFNVWGGHTRSTSSTGNVIYWIAIGITK